MVICCAALFSVLSVALCMSEPSNLLTQIAEYVVYALAAVFLTASVVLSIQFFKKDGRGKFHRAIHRTKITAKIYDDAAFRILLGARFSLLVNIFFALTKAAAG